jgi:nitrogen PTS system EIIA component
VIVLLSRVDSESRCAVAKAGAPKWPSTPCPAGLFNVDGPGVAEASFGTVGQSLFAMPRTLIGIKEVAASLHVSTKEVVRMAERGILPGSRVRGIWQFRAGEIWNWIEANLETLPARREKDRHPEASAGLLISPALKESAIAVSLVAKTKSSVLRALVELAEHADPTLDAPALVDALLERESQGSTALQDGVAVPHPSRPFYAEGPVLAAARTSQGVVFGERRGGLTDLFFLICSPDQVSHLLLLGRLCRLLLDPNLRDALRAAATPAAFADAIREAEESLDENNV